MPRELLTLGVPHTLVVGEVYALPYRAVYWNATGGTLETSNDGTTWTAIGVVQPVVAQLIRTTGTNSVITLKLA